MSLTLGVHVGSERVFAALAESDDLGATRVLMLGEDRAGIAAAVGAAADGSVVVGDAASRTEGTVITDALLRAGAGRRGALQAVLAHVLRHARSVGAEPQRLGVVVPDDFDAAARSQVIAAANSAGMTIVETVPYSAALARGTALLVADDLARAACGAAAIAAVDAPQIVTREDLGGSVEQPDERARKSSAASAPAGPSPGRPQPPAAPVVASRSQASVFDREPLHEPMPARPPRHVRPAGSARSGGATRDAVRRASVAGVPAAGDTPVEPAVTADSGSRQHAPVIALALGAVVVFGILAGMGIALLAGGNDDGSQTEVAPGDSAGEAADDDAEAGPDTVGSEPVAGGSDDAADPAASAAAASSSSSSSTSSSSTTSSSTTSTTPQAQLAAGAVVLLDNGLRFVTGDSRSFGAQSWEVLETTTAALGEPDYDSGLIVVSDCQGTRSRFVRYGSLELVFTETAEAPGKAAFSQWHLGAADDLARFAAPGGLEPGSTVGSLQYTYGDDLTIVAAVEGDTLGVFSVESPGGGAALYGLTDGIDSDGVVSSLWAGDSCIRAFT